MQTKARAPLDLTRDNRIRQLLEKRERQLAVIRRAEAVKREAEAEIREKMGDAVEAFTNDWTIEIKTIRPREYTAPAGTVLRCRRLEPAEEEKPTAGKMRQRARKRLQDGRGGLPEVEP